MDIIKVESFEATGFSVRTKNADEMSPSMAKIGQLWDKFFKEAAPKLTENSQVYGLYTHYESDYSGEFDVIACADTLNAEMLDGATQHTVIAGNYVSFSAQGEMPQAVIDLWGEVWAYFGQDNCPYTRAYTTDFERYIGFDRVEILIAVE